MNSLCEKLRAAREARGLSLDDIAASTRIQRKILCALEEGDFSGWPQTYLRAFLRSYAREVGLNEQEVLREYDETTRPKLSHPEQKKVVPPSPRFDFTNVSRKIKEISRKNVPLIIAQIKEISQRNVPLIIAGALVFSFVLSLFLFNPVEQTSTVKEVPFQEVVKQREAAIRVSGGRVDSTVPAPATATARSKVPVFGPPKQEPPKTLLVLRVMTFDSVWIKVTIDGKAQNEYHVPPRWSNQWKAVDRFLISVSNTDAVSFTLNNVSLGMIGESGQAVENYLVQSPAASVEEMPQQQQQ